MDQLGASLLCGNNDANKRGKDRNGISRGCHIMILCMPRGKDSKWSFTMSYKIYQSMRYR